MPCRVLFDVLIVSLPHSLYQKSATVAEGDSESVSALRYTLASHDRRLHAISFV